MLRATLKLTSFSRNILASKYKELFHHSYSSVAIHSSRVTVKNYFPVFSGFVVGYGLVQFLSDVSCTETEEIDTEGNQKANWKLYQYATCPFCNKVRVFLDFYGIDYEIIEVNPLFRKEIKFSEYRKVPILTAGEQQLNDSSLIISVLKSHLLGKGEVRELLSYYPTIETKDGRKKKIEYQNRYNVMYQQGFDKDANAKLKEETKWRRWVDDTFVHTLSPNIYRTMGESFKAMEYITTVGNFTSFEQSLVYYTGAVAMYIIGKRVKRRYRLRNDVRESMYAEAHMWNKAVGKKRKFLGGDNPNLADLNMYGVIRAIEGLDAFEDLMKNTELGPWYYRMKNQVDTHAGKKGEDWLLGKYKA